MKDKEFALELTALIAQIELGDLENETISTALLSYSKWLPISLTENSEISPLSNSKKSSKRRKHHSGASETENSSENEEASYEHEPNLFNLTASSDNTILTALRQSILPLHRNLKGMKSGNAIYLFLQKVASLEDFGVEYFTVRFNNGLEELFRFGVGPKGVTVVSEDTNELKHRFAFNYFRYCLPCHFSF